MAARVLSARRHPRSRQANEAIRRSARPHGRRPSIAWLGLFRFPQVWGLVFAKFLSDAAWYFYLFWLPKYLYDVRGFDTKQVGYYAWIPYAAVGNRQPVRRLVFQPPDPARAVARLLAQAGAGRERRGDAAGSSS